MLYIIFLFLILMLCVNKIAKTIYFMYVCLIILCNLRK